MTKVTPIEFILNKETNDVKLTRKEWEEIGHRTPPAVLSFSVKIPESDVDVFNRPWPFSGNAKRILYVYKGRVRTVEAWMESYHIGDGWVKMQGFRLENEGEFERLKKTLQIYKY